MKILILAGGSGTRLWPLSREAFPKQFLALRGGESLLQKTVKRFSSAFGEENIIISTNEREIDLVKAQLREFQLKFMVEPARKNTAPAVAFALKNIPSSEVIVIAPSDHLIQEERGFLDKLSQALKWAEEGAIVTFGIPPTRPETGYGYLEVEGSNVIRFAEKPSLEKAKEFLAQGNFFWNSGIFVMKVATFWSEAQKYAPFLCGEFSSMPEISLDCALMEKSKDLRVIPLNVGWSDIGSWDSVYDVLEKDENQNVKEGNVFDIETKNCFIYGHKRLISTYGLEDVLVVDTEDALFLGKKGHSQGLKHVVQLLKKEEKKEVKEHSTTHRPWGKYTVLEESARYKVKQIVVDPMQMLSLQKHEFRSEHWVVVKGRAKVTIGEKTQILEENQSAYVPKGEIHRLENPEKTPLEMIEVQVGDYVGEDDIIRLDDVYGRS